MKLSMTSTVLKNICIVNAIILLLCPSAITYASEGLPDLYIYDIHINRFTPDFRSTIGAHVENIGDEQVDETVYIKTEIQRITFGILPKEINRTFYKDCLPWVPILPGDTYSMTLIDHADWPAWWGFYRVHGHINYNQSIIESDYSNNQLTAFIFRIGGVYPWIINYVINP